MILKTKAFQEAANKILLAVGVDKSAANLELAAKDNKLFLRVTNREYYCAVGFDLEEPTEFRAVVDANLFLNLISGINTEDFELTINDTNIAVKAGKSSYKLAMIYENDQLMKLPVIKLDPEQVTIDMPIAHDILMSVLNVNGREIQKAKRLDVNELQRYYYIDETGCFTFTTGACVNSFILAKPIKLLLTDKVVKLFKLFNFDVWLSYGHQVNADGSLQPIVAFQTENVYVASRLLNDEGCIQKIKAPCDAMKKLVKENYDHNLVLSASEMSSAIGRLLMFHKNSSAKADLSFVPATVDFSNTELTITDVSGDNKEVITVENGSVTSGSYSMGVNLIDLKSVLDSCKNEHITVNCGNRKSIIINRGTISNVIAETRTKE
jgi:DNA polymerase III sliding clamp (beta) subunit (PCNA family)